MRAGRLGYLDTPAQRNIRIPGVPWAADNGAFSAAFRLDKWWRFLEVNAHDAHTCLFATAPDAVCDHQRTYRRADPWLDPIRDLGYPVAWVAQNGATMRPGSVPWDRFDVLFIGGDDAWKEGVMARTLIREALTRGKRIHCGRVNGERRYQLMRHLGVHTADGTYLRFGPDTNLPKMLRWGAQGDLLIGGAA